MSIDILAKMMVKHLFENLQKAQALNEKIDVLADPNDSFREIQKNVGLGNICVSKNQCLFANIFIFAS